MRSYPMALRVLALILLVVLLSLCSCEAADPGKNTDTTSKTDDPGSLTTAPDAETTITVDVPPLELPETMDFGGQTLHVLSAGGQSELMFREELRNDVVNDALFNREIWVEERLDTEIENTVCDGNLREEVEKLVLSGGTDVDLVNTDCAATMWSSQFGYYADLASSPNLDLSQPWWSQDFIRESSFGGKVYFLTGDLAIGLLQSTFVMFYNKDLAKNYNVPNIYELVFDGKWTLDKLAEVSSGIYTDMNGNSEKDMEDVYGLVMHFGNADPLWSAFDIDILSKDEDDYLIYTPDIEKFGNAFDRVWKLLHAESTYYNESYNPHQLFPSGHGVFAGWTMRSVESEEFRNMQYDYGLLPIPKFDEKQKDYYTMPADQYTVLGVPSTAPALDFSAAVLEAMGWYSACYVRPAYLDVAMKGQYANDPETRQILDIIVDGIRIDSAWIYAYYLADFPQMWRYMILNGNENYSSEFAAKERKIKILVKALNEAYQALP